MRILKGILLLTLLGSQAFGQAPSLAYEIFIRSFSDSDGDGIGDIQGITSKLDYLEELGVDMLWITPVGPSPSYHKYDVVDYRAIDPEYGTLEDYKNLVAEAHEKGISILLDLVINHSSRLHPWFLEAVKGPDNPYRDFYVWKTPALIDSLGIAIRARTPDSWEANPWHFHEEEEKEKYYGLFSPVMPDLNYDNPVVRDSIYAIGKWWLETVGVDGFRMDAAKHIYPQWDAPKAHAFWREFGREMKQVNPDVFVVGEVYADAEIVAPFFGGLQANFNIQMSQLLPAIVKQERDSGLVDFLLSSYQAYQQINPDFVDATLLTNHDQNRIGSVLEGDKNKMKVAAGLLLTLPGLPFLYYGEEIGMLGSKPDEDIREAFLWATQPNDLSRTHWREPVHSTEERVSPLSLQQHDPASLFQHYRKLIELRKSLPALSQVKHPNLASISTPTNSLIAFIRPHEAGSVLAIHNLSSTAQSMPKTPETERFTQIYWTPEGLIDQDGYWVIPPYGMLVLGEEKD